jgi:hypothetical protein
MMAESQERKVVVVIESSVLSDQDKYAPIRAVDQKPDTYFHSKNELFWVSPCEELGFWMFGNGFSGQ